MPKWPGCPVVACKNDLCAEGCQAMTEIAERLHVIRDQLRTGRFGQREVWEEWLAEAATENERLTALVAQQSSKHDADMLATQLAHNREIERLRAARALEPKP